jgi:hypothetical protein
VARQLHAQSAFSDAVVSSKSHVCESDRSLIYLGHTKLRKYIYALSAVNPQSTNNQWPTAILVEQIMWGPLKEIYNDRLNLFYERLRLLNRGVCDLALDTIWGIVCLTHEHHRTPAVGTS